MLSRLKADLELANRRLENERFNSFRSLVSTPPGYTQSVFPISLVTHRVCSQSHWLHTECVPNLTGYTQSVFPISLVTHRVCSQSHWLHTECVPNISGYTQSVFPISLVTHRVCSQSHWLHTECVPSCLVASSCC